MESMQISKKLTLGSCCLANGDPAHHSRIRKCTMSRTKKNREIVLRGDSPVKVSN